MLRDQLTDITEMYLELLKEYDDALQDHTPQSHMRQSKMVFSQTEDGGIIITREDK